MVQCEGRGRGERGGGALVPVSAAQPLQLQLGAVELGQPDQDARKRPLRRAEAVKQKGLDPQRGDATAHIDVVMATGSVLRHALTCSMTMCLPW